MESYVTNEKLVSILQNIKKAVESNQISADKALNKVASFIYSSPNDYFADRFEHYLDDNGIDYYENILNDSDEYSPEEIDYVNNSADYYLYTSDPTTPVSTGDVITVIDSLCGDVKHFIAHE